MQNPRNLPFAMYELAVYLPGGAVCLVLLKTMLEEFADQTINMPVGGHTDNAVQQVITAVVWLAASYLTGHLAAFISSYVIEKLVHNYLGFPSDVWLESERQLTSGKSREETFREIFDNNIRNRPKRWVPKLIQLLQIPAIVPLTLLIWLRPFGFYTPKIPSGLLNSVTNRFALFQSDIQINTFSRWEKAVEHFVANNCPSAYIRMYNYLVIYGVLRLMSLIILSILWFFIARDFWVKLDYHIIDWWHITDWKLTALFHALAFAYTLPVMAFAKFNRRYFEETILALVFGVKASPPISSSTTLVGPTF